VTAPVESTERDRRMAQQCLECVVCRRAREKQRGFAFWLVKVVEGGICPYCRAYERVYGRRAHEPAPPSGS
jgi:uncharacterized protein CbrC (UPF0167 family)